MTHEQRKLAAIMFTDMVGYSAMAQKNEALAFEFLQEHRRLLRPLFTKHGGNEIKTIGDAFLIEFSSAIGAVNCAIEMQKVLDEYNFASLQTVQIKIRIGIHIGDIVFHENDVYGDGVNIASRVESLSEPGGICITEDVYRLVHNKITVPVVRLGRSELKNIDFPVAIYRVLGSSRDEAFSFQSYLNFLFRRKVVRNRLVVALIAILGLFAVLQIFTHVKITDDERLPVMVADFDNQTGDEGLNSLSDMFVTFLGRSDHLNVIPRSEMLQIFKELKMIQVGRVDEVLGRQICEKENINVLVTATVRKFGDVYIIEMKVLDPIKGKYLVTLKEDGRGYESIPAIIEELSDKTTQKLEESADDLVAQLAKNTPGVIGAKAYQYYLEGEEHFEHLDYEWAEEKIRRTLALDPDFALANYRLAYLMWERGDKHAKEPIALAAKVAPTMDEKAQMHIAVLQHDIWQRSDQALQTCQDLIKKHPEDKEALYMMGDLLFRKADFENAAIYFEKALAVDPKFERAHLKLIAASQAGERYDRMLEYATAYVSLIGSESAYQQLARAYIVAGNFSMAKQTYVQALNKYSNSLGSLLGIGKIFVYEQNFDRAEIVFKSLLQKGKSVKEKKAGLRALAELYTYLGRYKE
ncbi:MAG: tetratricopeptide repeat protein, partial [Chlorobiales bacterium]|nr:tetratricopeptide repeat protein [Chlorobiales bacterium]